MSISTVAVIGAGQMGSGIAQVAATSGTAVILSDSTYELAERGLSQIKKALTRSVEKGRLSPEASEAALSRIRPARDLSAAGDADMAIEAVVEAVDVKLQVMEQLDSIMKPDDVMPNRTPT